jgi:hypothetical protein
MVYAECDSRKTPKRGLNKSKAREIAREYSKIIEPQITGVFGEISHIHPKQKITLLLLDIQDGYDPDLGGGFVGGYFYPDDMEDLRFSNKRDMLYIDTFPGLDFGMPAVYSTMAHELQHLISYSNNLRKSRNEQDLWINEGLSTAAEYIYGGDLNDRVVHYNYYNNKNDDNDQTTIRYGNNFFVWDGRLDGIDPAANYATAYLFFQWLRLHAYNDIGIYKDIIDSSYTDYRAVTEAARKWIPDLDLTGSPEKDWETLLRTWMLANVCQKSSGIYGYKDKIGEMTRGKTTWLQRWIVMNEGTKEWNFAPGEGMFTWLNDLSYTPPSPGESDSNIKYWTISAGELTFDLLPLHKGVLLTFNANADNKGSLEKGYLASTLAPSQEILGWTRSVQGVSKTPAMPRSYPVDIRYFLEKRKREGGDSFTGSLPPMEGGD